MNVRRGIAGVGAVALAIALSNCAAKDSSASATSQPLEHPAPLGDALATLANSTTVATGFIDEVIDANVAHPTPPKGTRAIIRGWCIDPVTKAPAGGLVLRVGRRAIDVSEAYGLPRVDIARVYQNDALLDTGYLIDVPATALSRGANTLEIGVVSSDRRTLYRYAKPIVLRADGRTVAPSART